MGQSPATHCALRPACRRSAEHGGCCRELGAAPPRHREAARCASRGRGAAHEGPRAAQYPAVLASARHNSTYADCDSHPLLPRAGGRAVRALDSVGLRRRAARSA